MKLFMKIVQLGLLFAVYDYSYSSPEFALMRGARDHHPDARKSLDALQKELFVKVRKFENFRVKTETAKALREQYADQSTRYGREATRLYNRTDKWLLATIWQSQKNTDAIKKEADEEKFKAKRDDLYNCIVILDATVQAMQRLQPARRAVPKLILENSSKPIGVGV